MSDKHISRREFSKKLLGTALSVSLLETLFTGCSSEKNIEITKTNNIVKPKVAEQTALKKYGKDHHQSSAKTL